MAYDWIIDGLDETWDRVDRLMRPQSEAAYDRASTLPGWSVRDVLSHLVGFELVVAGETPPALTVPAGHHVRNQIGEINEQFVQARRDRTGRAVLDEFREVTARSLRALRARDAASWEAVGWSPEGEVPFHRFMETRLLDSWIHLQDLRDSLALPEDDHGAGEDVVVNRFEGLMAYVVGRRSGAHDGDVVRFNLVGRLARTFAVRLDGTRAVPVAVTDGATVEITTPVALFWRRCAGRISARAFLGSSATSVTGDMAFAERIAEAMNVMI